MIETVQIPQHRRETISQAVKQAYQDADIDLNTLKPGIVPLYRLIQSYPISVDEIQDMTAQKVAEFLEADCFAGELLITEKSCYELAKRYQGRFGKKLDVLVGRLAPEFLVSKQAMKRRLEDLKIMEKL
ncbi:MAG: ImmA/IrrE family metallo-endopeptidase [Waterburya sp.]